MADKLDQNAPPLACSFTHLCSCTAQPPSRAESRPLSTCAAFDEAISSAYSGIFLSLSPKLAALWGEEEAARKNAHLYPRKTRTKSPEFLRKLSAMTSTQLLCSRRKTRKAFPWDKSTLQPTFLQSCRTKSLRSDERLAHASKIFEHFSVG